MNYRTDLAGLTLEIESPADGVTFRRFRGEDDYGHMARLLMATSKADGGLRYETADRIAVAYANLTNCDPYLDMIFAEAEGQPIAYSRVFWEDKLDGERMYGAFGWLHPEYRGQGIGSAMYEANEARVGKIAAEHPADLSKHMLTVTAEVDVTGMRLVEKHGFEPDMYLADMVRADLRDIPTAELPDGIVERTPTPDEYRKLWEAEAEAFRDHHGASEPQESWYEEFLADPNFDPTLWRIAWDGDSIVGAVRSFIDKEQNEEYGRLRGWTEDIFTDRNYRRMGIARALLCQSLAVLRDAGMKEAALSVHTDNPLGAYKLYESVGFVVERQDIFFKKPL
ncbi:MAG: GNAT family N-acetyltransferase [Acidimicrobiia bacterium]|nr:GNAT family N-acetyltransferase [Acidimicrobiia bacterium]